MKSFFKLFRSWLKGEEVQGEISISLPALLLGVALLVFIIVKLAL
jgi:hypothetical protein